MSQTENTPVMPAVFAGHGSPMNAIESNQFTENWKKLGETISAPKINSLYICTLGNKRYISHLHAAP